MEGQRALMCVGLSLMSLVCSSGVAAGQTTFGMIQGRVTDSTGAVLPGATVTVTNVRTADRRVVLEGVIFVPIPEPAPRCQRGEAPDGDGGTRRCSSR